MHTHTFRSELLSAVRAAAVKSFPQASDAMDTLACTLERPKHKDHGDFATNIAMVGARIFKQAPRQIAETLCAALADHTLIAEATVAGPGFINLRLSEQGWRSMAADLQARSDANFSYPAVDGKILVEFVSANPTGPLHVGHGRGAAVGDSLVRLLRATGHTVDAEYYVNDAGLQISNLGRSVIARAHEIKGETVDFPEDGYAGDYIVEIAREWLEESGDFKADIDTIGRWAGEKIRQGIEEDLRGFGVEFENWYSERDLHVSGRIEHAVASLEARKEMYQSEGALWLATEKRGDTKDRVVKRSNGVYTYFAADIAYHSEKIERGYTRLIDIWGADHHGYIPRVRAALEALELDQNALDVLLIQFVALLRAGKPVQMSTRSGTFETLKDLLETVGKDATRFFYLLRKPDTHLDFDLDLAVAESNENPVYYVQYAHARCCSVQTKVQADLSLSHWQELTTAETDLLARLDNYQETLLHAATELAPHQVVFYVQELAAEFHRFYNACPIARAEDAGVQARRLQLVRWTQAVLAHGLELVGVTAPQSM